MYEWKLQKFLVYVVPPTKLYLLWGRSTKSLFLGLENAGHISSNNPWILHTNLLFHAVSAINKK